MATHSHFFFQKTLAECFDIIDNSALISWDCFFTSIESRQSVLNLLSEFTDPCYTSDLSDFIDSHPSQGPFYFIVWMQNDSHSLFQIVDDVTLDIL